MMTLLAPRGSLVTGATLEPDPDEEHHLRVRRARDGEAIRLVDGAGGVARGRLIRTGRGFRVALEAVAVAPPPPLLRLGVGAGDKDRFGSLVEKAVELGATELIPLEMEHTRSVATRVRASHLPRLRRRALEALKQCGGAWALTVADLATLEEFAARRGAGARWLADPEGGLAPPLGTDAPATWVVGPEGGISGAERELLLEAGFRPIRLGPHVLRFDTAALAALVMTWRARQGATHG